MSDDKELITNDDRALYRVAVVVFANVRAYDYSDAGHLVERAVSQAVRSEEGGLVFRMGRQDSVWEVPVEVVDVVELSMAAGNGHVVVTPAIKPYRTYGNRAGKLPEGMIRPYDPAEEDED